MIGFVSEDAFKDLNYIINRWMSLSFSIPCHVKSVVFFSTILLRVYSELGQSDELNFFN